MNAVKKIMAAALIVAAAVAAAATFLFVAGLVGAAYGRTDDATRFAAWLVSLVRG